MVIRSTVIVGAAVLIYEYLSSYYPNYLSEVHGMPLGKAGALTGFMPFFGILGSFGIGAVFGKIYGGSRESRTAGASLVPFFLVLCNAAGYLGMALINARGPLFVSVALVGASFTAISTFYTTCLMQEKSMTPLVANTGIAVMSSCGSLLALFVPWIEGVLAKTIGLRLAMTVFAALYIPAFAALLSGTKKNRRVRP